MTGSPRRADGLAGVVQDEPDVVDGAGFGGEPGRLACGVVVAVGDAAEAVAQDRQVPLTERGDLVAESGEQAGLHVELEPVELGAQGADGVGGLPHRGREVLDRLGVLGGGLCGQGVVEAVDPELERAHAHRCGHADRGDDQQRPGCGAGRRAEPAHQPEDLGDATGQRRVLQRRRAHGGGVRGDAAGQTCDAGVELGQAAHGRADRAVQDRADGDGVPGQAAAQRRELRLGRPCVELR
ncbi:hypothetical protein [Saccharothrix ecbatanensis]|uniref:hypothetical protein n=1 Tax=Saccharothrix ecbatanensis TaxID=1105145 RepID=UPI00161E07AE|nr:hypothetical protein [Saccharothrix ecbatanensis]